MLRAAIRDGGVVGVGDGSSISAVADAPEEPSRETGATVVPLCGGYWFSGPAREPFRRIADAIGGVPQGLLAPGLVDDPATKRSLVAHAGVRRIPDLWDRLDVAVFGIGGPTWTTAALGKATSPPAREGRAVGELLMAPFDLDGQFVRGDLATGRSRSTSIGSIGPDPDRRRRRRREGPADPRRAAAAR